MKRAPCKRSRDKGRPTGPPATTLRIEDTPENVARSLFGQRSDTPGKVIVRKGQDGQ